VAAFGEFVADVASGDYPEPDHNVSVPDSVVAEFIEFLDGQEP
jgi:hypothetical protein